jgi:cold shock CspA family protein
MSRTSSLPVQEIGRREIGRVKWFNTKTGYGFINPLNTSENIFVHHSRIVVNTEQYRYLVEGEYVEFVSIDTGNAPNNIQASDVTGIGRGLLMCETRTISAALRESRPEEEVSLERPVQTERRQTERRKQPERSRSDGRVRQAPVQKMQTMR